MPAGARRSVRRPLLRFTLAGIIALLVLAVGSVWVSGRVGTIEAIRDARTRTTTLGQSVIEPALPPGIASGDPDAVAALDSVIRRRVLGDDLVRVKIWSSDGTIVYSDEPRLIGITFGLGGEELEALGHSEAEAEVGDLNQPENQYERGFGKLLEVYLPLRTATGEVMLFEAYYEYDSVLTESRAIWLLFAPVMLLSLLALEVIQVPLAWTMARELEERQGERERLLERAIESSDMERRRIARDLHDGVVQDLTALSFDLAAAGEIREQDPEHMSDLMLQAAQETRRGISSLRSLLVEIYPPNLHEQGVSAAIADLMEPLNGRGITTSAELASGLRLSREAERIVYRVAQESLRNVVTHSEASRVDLQLTADRERIYLTVADDGRGFDAEAQFRDPAAGHVGMRLLSDFVEERGGRLTITSAVGHGTTVRLDVPR
jgi:signal transduction histidine kinase